MKARNLMQEKIRCLICVTVAAALLVTLAGCKPKEKDYLDKPGQADAYIRSHPVGTIVRYDLNGDGTGESITVNTNEYEAGKLTIGDDSVEIWSATPTGYFTVLNVDDSKDTLLVGISDYGPSDDPETVFYAYDGTSIREVGYLTDIFGQNIYGHDSAVCHGDGTVTAGKRWDVLGTWNSFGLYQVSETGIKDITDIYHYVPWDGQSGGWDVTVLKMLIMNEEIENYNSKVLIPAGTRVSMTGIKKGSDANTYWACFETESGNGFWLMAEMVDWVTYVPGADDIITSEEAFDGFFYAG